MPNDLQGKLVIVVRQSYLANIINEVKNIEALYPQYSEPWIVFDRDQVKNFDDLIEEAKNKGINVGWSNPCIEIWFSAYFGAMPTYQDSISCCNGFETDFKKVTNQKYDKSDNKIYPKLCKYGDEPNAIKLAAQKLKEKEKQCDKPSQMYPATTVHTLVEEIKGKIEVKKHD